MSAADDYSAWLERGRRYLSESQPVESVFSFRRALRSDPAGIDALRGLVTV